METLKLMYLKVRESSLSSICMDTLERKMSLSMDLTTPYIMTVTLKCASYRSFSQKKPINLGFSLVNSG